MSYLTGKQIRQLLKEFSTKPGYIHNKSTGKPFTRAEFEELFDELESDVDILGDDFAELGDSVAKRLTHFLKVGSDADVEFIINELRD